MKEAILRALREADGYLSGQELAGKLSVSRTAVWKNIRQLQAEGYKIEAVSNRGYRLVESPDNVTEEELTSLLDTEWIGAQVYCYDQVTSTNQVAKALAEEGAADGALVVANEQTAGKGRYGRHWGTPAGKTIAMTLILRPKLPPEQISMVTLVAGMAVAQACREICHVDACIKWPNDVVVNGKKICGILTEMTTDIHSVSYIVVGIGINTRVSDFPPELCDKAASLHREMERLGYDASFRRSELIAAVMKCFEMLYTQFLKTGDLSSLKDCYEQLLVNRDAVVRVLSPGNEYTGRAEGINDRGELLVRREDGTLEKVYAGEVSVRGVLGYV